METFRNSKDFENEISKVAKILCMTYPGFI